MKRFLVFLPALALPLLLLPTFVFAQSGPQNNFGYIGDLFAETLNLINNILIPLVFAVAVLAFFWGVFTYFILGGSDEGEREKGRKLMLYAIIGFVVMVALFGIIELLQNALNLNTGSSSVPLPSIENSSGTTRPTSGG